MEAYEYFVYYLMAPIVFGLGLVGNMTALVVLFKGKLKKMGPVLTYKLMFIFDTLNIFQIITFYLQYPFYLDITILSRFSCKLVVYLNYQMNAVSTYLLVYISIEKYISINNPSKRRILNSKKNQIISLIGILVFCSSNYIAILFLVDLSEYNQTNLNGTNNSFSKCYPINYEAQLILSVLDLVNREILPGSLMIFFSFMLVLAVWRSSSRVAHSINDQNRRKRDVRLAINCFFMNFIFILLQTPVLAAFFLPELIYQNLIFYSVTYIFYLSYGINFFIIVVCNSMFRKEFYKILRKRHRISEENPARNININPTRSKN